MKHNSGTRGRAKHLSLAGLVVALVALFVATLPITAVAEPTLDGSIDDVIAQANAYIQSGLGSGIVIHDPGQDVFGGDTVIAPCHGSVVVLPGGGIYFTNGFDITLVAFAAQDSEAWLGLRVNGGQIGDSDGDGTDGPGMSCDPQIGKVIPYDPPGIGDGEHYTFSIDTNCDGVPDYVVSVSGGADSHRPSAQVTNGVGTPLPNVTAEAQYQGSDLEIHESGLPLTSGCSLSARASSGFDGLASDGAGPVHSNLPAVSPALALETGETEFCLGQAAEVRFRAGNPNRFPLPIAISDLLPGGWTYIGSTGSVPATVQGQRVCFGPINVAPGDTLSASFNVAIMDGCPGPGENRVVTASLCIQTCPPETLGSLSDTMRTAWSCSSEPCLVAAGSIPLGTELGAPSPSPFRERTSMPYTVGGSSATNVDIGVFNVAGRMIRKLVNADQLPGRYLATWDAQDRNGSPVAGGVYFVRAEIGGVLLQSAPHLVVLR